MGRVISHQPDDNGILVGGIPTPLNNMSLSVGMMKFHIYGKKIKAMFQTTNQPFIFHYQRVNHH